MTRIRLTEEELLTITADWLAGWLASTEARSCSYMGDLETTIDSARSTLLALAASPERAHKLIDIVRTHHSSNTIQ